MALTTQQAKQQLKGFGRWRTEQVVEIMAEGEPDDLHGDLALGAFSKECDLRNVNGPRYVVNGLTVEDKGLGQASSYWHKDWLKGIPGTDPGSYKERYPPSQGGAYPLGRVPAGLRVQVVKWRGTMRYNVTYSRSRGVKEQDVLHVALAGYNAGIGTAINAYLRGEDPDTHTTNGNYAATVLERRRIIGRARRELGW